MRILCTFIGKRGQNWKNCNSVNFTPTISWCIRAIRAHRSKGEHRDLREYIESGWECNNNILQLLRIAQSNNCSQLDNLNDCINSLWMVSYIHIKDAVPSKETLERNDSQNSKQKCWGSFPFSSLAEYYIKELDIEVINL